MEAGRLYGKGMAFPPRVGSDRRIAWSEGEDNIRESMRVILMTIRASACVCRTSVPGLAAFC